MIYTWQSRASLVSESGLELLAYIWHLKKAFAEYKPCKKQFYNNVYLYIIFYLLYRIPLPLLTIFQTWSCCIHLVIDVTNLIMLYSVHLAIDITNLIMLYSVHLAIDVTNLIMLYSVHLAIDVTNNMLYILYLSLIKV
jgi:hypothetical protein